MNTTQRQLSPDAAITPVQALRAFAALSAGMVHILGEAGAMYGTPGRSPWPWLSGYPWEAGVDLFFVISGFVMVYSSRGLFGRPATRWLFLGRRIARIVPIYWLVTTMFILMALAVPITLDDPFGSWSVVAASYFFLPWQRPNGSFLPVFRLGWTLNYEMLFYVIFAVAIRQSMRQAVGMTSAALLALIVLRNIHAPEIPQLIFWSDPIIIEFIFGMAVGWFVVEGGRIPRFGILVGVLGMAALVANPVDNHGLPRWLGFGLPGTALLLGCLVPTRQTWLLAALGRVGSASYAFYLIHLFVARAVREVWERTLGPRYLGFYVLVTIIAAVMASLVMYDRFEVPATRVVRRWLGVGSKPRQDNA